MIAILINIIKLAIFFLVLYLSFLMVTEAYDINLDVKIKKGVQNFIETEQEAQFQLLKNKYYIKKKKTSNYRENLNKLILKSGINLKFQLITPTTVIVLSTITSIFCFLISFKISNNLFAAAAIAFTGYNIPRIIIFFIADYKGSKVDSILIDYLNLLINFCTIKDDIVYAVENSIPFIAEPLKTYSEIFVFEVKHGIMTVVALQNLSDKIDNLQFKFLCKSLQLCCKNTGKYLSVLFKSKELYMKYYEKYLDRKKEAKKGRNSLFAMIILSALVFYFLIYINPDLVQELKVTKMGKCIVFYNILVYIITFFVAVNISKFEY